MACEVSAWRTSAQPSRWRQVHTVQPDYVERRGADRHRTQAGSGPIIWSDEGSASVIGFVTAPMLNFTKIGNSLNMGITNYWTNYQGGSPSPVTVPIDVINRAFFF